MTQSITFGTVLGAPQCGAPKTGVHTLMQPQNIFEENVPSIVPIFSPCASEYVAAVLQYIFLEILEHVSPGQQYIPTIYSTLVVLEHVSPGQLLCNVCLAPGRQSHHHNDLQVK